MIYEILTLINNAMSYTLLVHYLSFTMCYVMKCGLFPISQEASVCGLQEKLSTLCVSALCCFGVLISRHRKLNTVLNATKIFWELFPDCGMVFWYLTSFTK